MTRKDEIVMEMGKAILQTPDLSDNEWNSLALVFDVGKGHRASSGFLYTTTDIIPIIARPKDRLALDNLIKEFWEVINQEYGAYFKQLLIQMDNSGRIKIDFEFNDPKRWSVSPVNIKESSKALRPVF